MRESVSLLSIVTAEFDVYIFHHRSLSFVSVKLLLLFSHLLLNVVCSAPHLHISSPPMYSQVNVHIPYSCHLFNSLISTVSFPIHYISLTDSINPE